MLKLFIATTLLALTLAASFPDCKGTENTHPLITDEPKFLNSTKNGAKYYIESKDDNSSFVYIGIFEGTPYEMGYAYGELFKEEITYVMEAMGIVAQFATDSFPQWMQDLNMDDSDLVDFALRLEQIATGRYTPQHFFDEMKGMADATGLSYDQIYKINLFPEASRGQCTVAGFWGPATPDGNMIQLRSLDWNPSAPMNMYPVISIQRANLPGANQYANFGYAGVIGALSGYSGKVAISEASWLPELDNETSIFGIPWMFALRDILQFSNNVTEAANYLNSIRRTYKLYLGVGSPVENYFRGFTYIATSLEEWSDKNWTKPFSDIHPQFDGIMYFDKSSHQTDSCPGEVFKGNYGKITPEVLYQQLTAMDHTGDTMVAVYDFPNDQVFLSYSSSVDASPAYSRPLFQLNMTYWFNLPINSTNSEDMQRVEI